MENIIIVEVISTGRNYIQDIVKNGYNAIVLELKEFKDKAIEKETQEERQNSYKFIKEKYEIIKEQEKYEDTLEIIKKLNPKIILPGTEYGVELATRLSNDLGLLSNSYSNIKKMTNKNEMQNALKEYGIRYIQGNVVKNIDEGLALYDKIKNKDVVVKHPHGAGSVGIHVCHNKEELKVALETEFNSINLFGEEQHELLIQEEIKGEEYICNTVSCNGTHRITTILKYIKETVDGGGVIFRGIKFINELSPEYMKICLYALQVANAIGVKYGPIHGEYIIDEKGPVLIEVNCRPMGGNFPGDFLDKISGQHETDSALEAYLNPESFLMKIKNPQKGKFYGLVKCLCANENMKITSTPMISYISHLKSFYSAKFNNYGKSDFITKTISFHTSTGLLYLCNENEIVLQKEFELLEEIEKFCFSLLYEQEKDCELLKIQKKENLLDELGYIDVQGRTLILRNGDAQNWGKDFFDNIIVDFSPIDTCVKLEEFLNYFISLISRLNKNGKIIVTQNTYNELENGEFFISAIMKIFDLELQLPTSLSSKLVIGKNIVVEK